MTLSEAIRPYRDQYGLVHPNRDLNSTNGLTYTAYYMALLKERGELTEQECEAYSRTVLACEKEPGLLNRYPNHWQQQKIDDYACTIRGAEITGRRGLAWRIDEYGKNHAMTFGPIKRHYFYNNERPGTNLDHQDALNWAALWIGNQPLFKIYLSWARGNPHGSWESFLFRQNCIITARVSDPGNQDAFLQLWLSLVAFGDREKDTRSAVIEIMKNRKISFRQSFESYFTEGCPFPEYFNEPTW